MAWRSASKMTGGGVLESDWLAATEARWTGFGFTSPPASQPGNSHEQEQNKQMKASGRRRMERDSRWRRFLDQGKLSAPGLPLAAPKLRFEPKLRDAMFC